LRKVAIAQGFRLAFPDELGSFPYETAELLDNEAAPEPQAPANHNPVKTSIQTLAEQAASDDSPDVKASSQQRNPSKTPPKAKVNEAQQAQAPSAQDSELDEETRDKLIRKIEDLFDEHPKDFTQKHKEWILNNALKATDRAGIGKMIAYTEKVIKKAA
jgi:acyl-CoA reductase-like NAD-dependent aldehyde dehydrogenase